MFKELHLYLDSKEYEPSIYTTYCDTERGFFRDIVRTTQTSFLSFDYCERLFVHVNGETHEITLGECEGTDKIIRKNTNLPKLLLDGGFDWFEN